MADQKIIQQRVRDYFGCAQESEEVFVSQFKYPFLVLVDIDDETELEDERYFTTRISRLNLKTINDIAAGKSLDPESIVFPVIKRQDINPFEGMVTVGRARNCDIVIPLPGVSKFHFYIRASSIYPDRFVIGDPGSRNGTIINDRFMAAKRKTEIKNGDSIVLGTSVKIRFFTAQGFWDVLRASDSRSLEANIDLQLQSEL